MTGEPPSIRRRTPPPEPPPVAEPAPAPGPPAPQPQPRARPWRIEPRARVRRDDPWLRTPPAPVPPPVVPPDRAPEAPPAPSLDAAAPRERLGRLAPLLRLRVLIGLVAAVSGIVGGIGLADVHPLLGVVLGAVWCTAPALWLWSLVDDLAPATTLLALVALAALAGGCAALLVDLDGWRLVALGLAPLAGAGVVLAAWTGEAVVRDLLDLDDRPPPPGRRR